jgi:hypothetical protein
VLLGSAFCGPQQVAETMLVNFPHALARPFQVHLQGGLNAANEQQVVPSKSPFPDQNLPRRREQHPPSGRQSLTLTLLAVMKRENMIELSPRVATIFVFKIETEISRARIWCAPPLPGVGQFFSGVAVFG